MVNVIRRLGAAGSQGSGGSSRGAGKCKGVEGGGAGRSQNWRIGGKWCVNGAHCASAQEDTPRRRFKPNGASPQTVRRHEGQCRSCLLNVGYNPVRACVEAASATAKVVGVITTGRTGGPRNEWFAVRKRVRQYGW